MILYFIQKRVKNIHFGAAHTYIGYIREYPHRAKNALQRLAYASETNKLRGEIWLKTKTKRKIYLQQGKNKLSRESNLDHLHGESVPRPLRQATEDNVHWENYYI